MLQVFLLWLWFCCDFLFQGYDFFLQGFLSGRLLDGLFEFGNITGNERSSYLSH